MTDFLDRLGEQLVLAERQLTATARPATPRRWRTGRVAAVALAMLAVAVPATAATKPWQLVFGRPELRDAPASLSPTSVPKDQLAAVGVLRRPQNEQDRSAATRTLLRSVGVEFRGVRQDSVRLVSLARHSVAIVSAERVGNPAGGGDSGERNVLCLVSGEGGTCGDTTALTSGRLTSFAGDHVFGLVPDGVGKVVLRYPHGATVSGDVSDNLFWVDGTATTSRGLPGAPPIAMPERPSAVQWLDANGRVIGPPS